MNLKHESPSGSSVYEALTFLEANPDIEAIDIVMTDSNGIGRGKIIRRHELISIYENGRYFPVSILTADITGEDVDVIGLGWDTGDGDLRTWPVPGTLSRLHGTNPPHGEVLMSMYSLDGDPMTSDPRHALQRQVDEFAKLGLKAAGAFELEFFLLSNTRDAHGRVQPAAAVLDGQICNKTEVYSVDYLLGMEPLFSDIYAGAKTAGIPAETLISEYAPGQYELTLHYRDDIVQAADDLIRLKRLVRAQARRHGITACFMAKPLDDYAGSGMHIHVSMQDEAGRNIFAEKKDGVWAPHLLNALGGLKETMAESMLVFAPHANSWRRFTSNSCAPVAATWGVNNRSVALRIPAGCVESRRIEHRPSGVDANPYLVAAAVLAGIRHGLDNRIDPGPETTGNGYEGCNSRSNLPPDWRSAIAAAKSSSFLKKALGEGLHRTFTAIKEAEYLRVNRTVSNVDYDLYLNKV